MASDTISKDMYNYFKTQLNNALVDGGFASKWNTESYKIRISKSRRQIFKRKSLI